jgi:hypothetical protein
VIPLIPMITSQEAEMMGRQTGDQASLFYEFSQTSERGLNSLSIGSLPTEVCEMG